MPKCPYCENAIELEELEIQRVKVRNKLPKMSRLGFITATLCPHCDSILSARISFR
ncbi:MAG: hypothetical protein ACFFCI_24655 [Promethearchaeota archaeon]